MNIEIPSFGSPTEEASYWKKKALEYKQSLDETREELEEFQTSSRELESELEAQLEQQELRCSELRLQINRLAIENQLIKERLQKEQSEYCSELTKLQEELLDINNNKEQLIKYIRELEQANDDLERTKRATVASLEDFESKLNHAIERNAVLESELDEKDILKDMVQRLKDEARDLRQEVSVKSRCDHLIPDNDHAVKQHGSNALHLGSMHSTPSRIDSNKLSERSSSDYNSNGSHNFSGNSYEGLPDESVPLTPSSRISAINIVGDLLRKVGALESRLASCRTLVKENQRPLSFPSSGSQGDQSTR